MNSTWNGAQVAEAARGRLIAGDGAADGPSSVVVDSRLAGPGVLFVGLLGEQIDGGEFAAGALDNGAWGVIVDARHADQLRQATSGIVIAVDDPLAALASLASRWRSELGCAVIAITGSTGKTSTKDIVAGMLAPDRRTVATFENFNTEIGLPLTILGAPAGT